ncbi:MAG: sugar transferase, partial [Clostridiales bacterium]|nr:sugar transferase [Clostridiales bacterium]
KDLIEEYGLDKKFNVVKTASVEECLDDMSMIDDMEVVFFSGIHSHDRNVLLKYCIYNNKQVYMIPRIGDVIMSSAQQMHMFHLPMLRVNRYNPSPMFLFVKRVFDIVCSFLGLIVLSPVFLVTAIAIKATDKGPVFYKQERLTKDGKRFMIHKFRSMRVDAEKDGVARLSTGDNDDRITPVGRFIRKCRIDELPQLIDILAGNLSVVGPRPERPEIAAEYEIEMPEFQLRLQAKAGLTGYAQVYGKYNTTPYDKLQMDLMYIARPSLAEDMRICFATVKILFMPDSTEGVAEGQTTAMDSGSNEVE